MRISEYMYVRMYVCVWRRRTWWRRLNRASPTWLNGYSSWRSHLNRRFSSSSSLAVSTLHLSSFCLCTGSVGHGSWVNKSGWVIWVMTHWPLRWSNSSRI